MPEPNYNPADAQDLSGLLYLFEKKLLRELRVCLPAIVEDFSRSVNRATVTPAITLQTTDGKGLQFPSISDVPVCAVGGGGFVAAFPLQKGDTGWLIFSDKDISLFKDSETISPANTLRTHDLADAVFVPDVMGKAQISGNGAVWQTYNGSVKAEITNEGFDITGDVTLKGDVDITGDITIKGDITSTGDMVVTGDITATGTITSATDVIAGGISLKSHVHGGVSSGQSKTGVAE